MTNPPNPKQFYDTVMPSKLGGNYESARWEASPLLAAQYRMMADALERWVVPSIRHARHVLEVGPGPGTWTKLLLHANSEAGYTLVDISREMFAQARVGLAGRSNVSFVESDFLAFDSSQPFDFFFSSRAIEYMSDKRAVVRKIESLLAPGARGAIISKMPKPFLDRLRARGSRALHSAQMRSGMLVRLLQSRGFVIENVRIATATVPLVGSATLNSVAYRLLKHVPLVFPVTLFAESFLITFRKPV